MRKRENPEAEEVTGAAGGDTRWLSSHKNMRYQALSICTSMLGPGRLVAGRQALQKAPTRASTVLWVVCWAMRDARSPQPDYFLS